MYLICNVIYVTCDLFHIRLTFSMNSEVIPDAGLCYVIFPRSFLIHSECELRSSVSPNTIECRWQAAHQDFDKKKM
jgi:hypothetical protein